MRAFGIVVLLAVLLGAPGVAYAQDDIPDSCRTIVGCPDAGPAPENPGDRGGYAQLLTLGVLAAGVGFITWKISSAVRARDRLPVPPVSRRDPRRSP